MISKKLEELIEKDEVIMDIFPQEFFIEKLKELDQDGIKQNLLHQITRHKTIEYYSIQNEEYELAQRNKVNYDRTLDIYKYFFEEKDLNFIVDYITNFLKQNEYCNID